MKLSKKGRDRLYGSHNVFYDDDIEGDVVALYELSEVWEFEPEDFTEAVVLSIEEAKQVKTFLDDAVELHDKGIVLIQSNGFETIQLIKDRIKKAEVQDEIK